MCAFVGQETCTTSFAFDNHESRHSNLPSATSRICHKLGKVCVDTSAGNRVFGPDNQLCHPGTFFKQNKNSESSFRMLEFVKQSTNISSGVDKVDWLVDVNYSRSFTSKVELLIPSNATNIIFIGKRFLFRQNCSERKLKNRTEMVGTKLRTVQWYMFFFYKHKFISIPSLSFGKKISIY